LGGSCHFYELYFVGIFKINNTKSGIDGFGILDLAISSGGIDVLVYLSMDKMLSVFVCLTIFKD
jgi:hypothetical protein